MNREPDQSCRNERRRHDTRQAPLYGLDFVEVDTSGGETVLEVFFLGKAPPDLTKENVSIYGGRGVPVVEVRDLRVRRQKDPTLDDSLELRVKPPNDPSTYRLALVKLDANGRATGEPLDGFDPRYSAAEFSFCAGCPSDLDCKPDCGCPPPARATPDINYLAKDYDSFRQLMLDRMALVMPDWRERHAPDLGIALVEVLAYAGDYLSYYQDAVATEAYLGTARQRISVRRHARLVDYAMHEGCNARAWVTVATDTDAVLDAGAFFFITEAPSAPDLRVFSPQQYAELAPGSVTVFEPLVADYSEPVRFYAAHSELHFYTWGDALCCLPTGARCATLVDAWVAEPGGPETGPTVATARAADVSDGPPRTRRALNLAVGDVLVLEELVGPGTGNPADADPLHRQAVRLTKVTRATDPLYHPWGPDYGQPIVEIEWCSEDALAFPLCISAKLPAPGCESRDNVSVARGNVLLVDHGARMGDELGAVPAGATISACATCCDPPTTRVAPTAFRPQLSRGGLTFSVPLPPCGCASALAAQDPRAALPSVKLTGTQTTAAGLVVTSWTPRADLFASGASDSAFVVEMDDAGGAHLRFGDGSLGRRPDAGTEFVAAYRVGNGPSGNVGAETLRAIVFRSVTSGVGALQPRNPLPARGGTAPESLDEVKLFAPFAFRGVLERAITAEDYAALAADDARRLAERPRLFSAAGPTPLPLPVTTDDPRAADEVEPAAPALLPVDPCTRPFRRLQGARATLRWNGSFYEALVAVDPFGKSPADAGLCREIEAYLEPYRRIGHDVDVQAARYVPLALTLSICVKPTFQRGHVEAALRAAFGTSALPDGTLGFFHPDNLTFAEGIYVSRLVARAQSIPGVMEADVARLVRFDASHPGTGLEEQPPAGGVLALGPFEIARLDNDASAPENGVLKLILRGGR